MASESSARQCGQAIGGVAYRTLTVESTTGDDLLGKDDIRRGLKLLLNEPQAPAPRENDVTALTIARDNDSEMLSTLQLSQVILTTHCLSFLTSLQQLMVKVRYCRHCPTCAPVSQCRSLRGWPLRQTQMTAH